jgi:hypothetical protein
MYCIVKRGRGRPRKSISSDIPTTETVKKRKHSVDNVSVKRGRGRPRKSLRGRTIEFSSEIKETSKTKKKVKKY